MQLLIHVFMLLAVLPLVAASSLSEGLSRQFNGQKWKEIDHHEDAKGLVVEYTPVEQNQSNWMEKVTVQVFPGKGLSIKDYVDQFDAILQTRKDVTFSTHIVEDKPEDKIYEWTLTNKSGQQEMVGWMRVVTDEKALKAIHIQVKNPKDIQALRSDWIKVIKDYDFMPRS